MVIGMGSAGSANPEDMGSFVVQLYDQNGIGSARVIDSLTGLFASIYGVEVGEGYYYLFGVDAEGNSQFARVDSATDQPVVYPVGGNYILKKWSLSGDSILFNALRLPDGALVTVKIGPDGEQTTLSDLNDREVIAMTRIQ